jgi:hypothetical protein
MSRPDLYVIAALAAQPPNHESDRFRDTAIVAPLLLGQRQPGGQREPEHCSQTGLFAGFSVASGIIDPTSMTSRAPAAKPSIPPCRNAPAVSCNW